MSIIRTVTGDITPDQLGLTLSHEHLLLGKFEAKDAGRSPVETFYDVYVVNAIIDAFYRAAENKMREPIQLELWRSGKSATSFPRQAPACFSSTPRTANGSVMRRH